MIRCKPRCPPIGKDSLCSKVLLSKSTQKTDELKEELYIGLETVNVDGAVLFDLLQVPRGNRRLLPLRRRPDALLQLHQPGHVRRYELVFAS